MRKRDYLWLKERGLLDVERWENPVYCMTRDIHVTRAVRHIVSYDSDLSTECGKVVFWKAGDPIPDAPGFEPAHQHMLRRAHKFPLCASCAYMSFRGRNLGLAEHSVDVLPYKVGGEMSPNCQSCGANPRRHENVVLEEINGVTLCGDCADLARRARIEQDVINIEEDL